MENPEYCPECEPPSYCWPCWGKIYIPEVPKPPDYHVHAGADMMDAINSHEFREVQDEVAYEIVSCKGTYYVYPAD